MLPGGGQLTKIVVICWSASQQIIAKMAVHQPPRHAGQHFGSVSFGVSACAGMTAWLAAMFIA
jgi:hypothetical protein